MSSLIPNLCNSAQPYLARSTDEYANILTRAQSLPREPGAAIPEMPEKLIQLLCSPQLSTWEGKSMCYTDTVRNYNANARREAMTIVDITLLVRA